MASVSVSSVNCTFPSCSVIPRPSLSYFHTEEHAYYRYDVIRPNNSSLMTWEGWEGVGMGLEGGLKLLD